MSATEFILAHGSLPVGYYRYKSLHIYASYKKKYCPEVDTCRLETGAPLFYFYFSRQDFTLLTNLLLESKIGHSNKGQCGATHTHTLI